MGLQKEKLMGSVAGSEGLVLLFFMGEGENRPLPYKSL